jgi:hypothetical protein
MFTFETANSIYSVRLLTNGVLEILKTAEINSRSTFNAVGVPRYANSFSFSGGRMSFDGTDGQYWVTSKVQRFL